MADRPREATDADNRADMITEMMRRQDEDNL
jgi:hypothetical protein